VQFWQISKFGGLTGGRITRMDLYHRRVSGLLSSLSEDIEPEGRYITVSDAWQCDDKPTVSEAERREAVVSVQGPSKGQGPIL